MIDLTISEASAIYADGDDIYIKDPWSRALFCFNPINGNIKHICTFNKAVGNKAYLFCNVLRYEDTMIFVPHMAEAIGTYNLKKNTCDYIKLPLYAQKSGYFYSGIVSNDKLIMAGYLGTKIIAYDFHTECFEVVYEGDNSLFAKDLIVKNNYLYIVSERNNTMVVIDLDNNNFSLVDVSSGGYNNLVAVDNTLIMTPESNNNFLKYNIKDKSLSIIDIPSDCNGKSYFYGFKLDDSYYVVPWFDGDLIRIDTNNMTCSVDEQVKRLYGKISARTACYDGNGSVYLMSEGNDKLIKYMPKEGSLIEYTLKCSINDYGELYDTIILKENKMFNLAGYLKSLYSIT